MNRDFILRKLEGFVVKELLDGAKGDLNENTPLLQWGILDSLAMVRMLSFIEEDFSIEVPDESVRPEYFESLGRLADLLVRLSVRAA